VGSACQRQCRAAPSPDWLLWAAVSERAGRLKSRSDGAVRTAAVRTHARAPDRAAARARLAPHAASRPHHRLVRHRPSLSGHLRRREHVHSERRPSSPLAVLHPWSVELTFPSLLTIAGPPLAIVAPPRRRNATAEMEFFHSPSTRSSGELFFPPPCPAGSLTIVGARPPPFAPPPPLWRHCLPRHNARPGAVPVG
jgi:hypothetical protein